MKSLVIVPNGWPCSLAKCPPGFFTHEEDLCFKSSYRTNGHNDAYLDDGSEFWGGGDSPKNRDKLIVQPVVSKWSEE